MTLTQFETLCGNVLIEPSLALENEEIVEALRNRQYSKVEELLANQF